MIHFPQHFPSFSDIVLSFAAGVMLAAAVLGLILPSIEYGGEWGLLYTIPGIIVGALCLNLLDKLVPHLHKLVGTDSEAHHNASLDKVLLFVMVIAIHNQPEGIAAGVDFGSEDISHALLIAGSIALHNIPGTHAHGAERSATWALLIGFCVMLISDVLLG